jgi:hypothetical protein
MWELPHTVDCIPSRAGVCLASNRRSPAESREDVSSIFLRLSPTVPLNPGNYCLGLDGVQCVFAHTGLAAATDLLLCGCVCTVFSTVACAVFPLGGRQVSSP